MASTADRLRPVPPSLTREADVVAALDRIGDLTTSGGQGEASLLTASGLLAISIPASFGGADISNMVAAEAVSRLVTWNAAVADRLVRHLVALELVRTSGSTEQRKAIYGRVVLGDVFQVADCLESAALPRLVRSGLSFMLEPAGSLTEAASVDWQILVASAAGPDPVAAILDHTRLSSRDAEGSLTVPPDHVLTLGPFAERLARLMQAFLTGAATRGRIGATAFSSSGDPSVAVELELLDAMIQKAAFVVDGIQVDEPPVDTAQIDRLCQALDTARLRCSDTVTHQQ